MPVRWPKPKREIQRANRFWPTSSASVIAPTFEE